MARVTVLLPVKAYHPPYLEQAIGSVTSQTSPDWRLLIIVDAADLGHCRATLSYLIPDSRVALIPGEGRALAGNLNTGMRHATTEFAASLFQDDLWAPEAVEVLTRYIESHPEVDFFNSSRRYINEDGAPISGVYRSKPIRGPQDFEYGSPAKHLLCWRVSKALSFGGIDESLDAAASDDWDFPWTMAEHGAAFMPIDECLYLYRDHRTSFRLTTHVPLSQYKHGMRRIMTKHGVDRRVIRSRIASAEDNFLRQCLYRSRLDKWLKERLGYKPRSVWREPYR